MAWHLSVQVDRDSAVPLTAQLQNAIKSRVEDRVLHPGARLPSSRQLAQDLGLSRSVVVEAYEQLIAEGYLDAVRGSGTHVTRKLPEQTAASPLLDARPASGPRWDLRVGIANLSSFPRQEWLNSYTKVLQNVSREGMDYPPVAGIAELRNELAGYLGRVRSVRAEPAQVMITAGFAQGLALLSDSLQRLGLRELAIEDPGHSGQRRFILDTGITPLPVPVDEEGLDVAALARTGARAVLVTPAHQFPTGVMLSPERRRQLLAWARERDGWIIEDDYDGEFWFDHGVRPTALQEGDPERVVYAGTTSKVLVPGLRLGWLAIPPKLYPLMERVRSRQDQGSDTLTQLAFAEMMRSGLLDRHLRRVRSRYRSRRDALAAAVRESLPDARICGCAAGLHSYALLPPGTDEAAVVHGALRRSVLVRGGQQFRFRGPPGPPALLLGYGSLPLTGINDAMAAIGEAYEEARQG
ncbi:MULTISPECIES: MocR-like pyridoxine biosynthesis transcription factor PdxR [unclassified Streptomyces]|uniref:MocR-like pyridoxine biosynthesis transcription factor PdxR n=1 Tax=unclassified Streptomyces TaxID=2593676 RepID=UPI0024416C62|nr:PLP-dependent aminotransferase family protein [Streptomyces sp. DH41]MDG9722059.1 PLP-dependent aminotransferase family protein [Streptomyces sp. DH41]